MKGYSLLIPKLLKTHFYFIVSKYKNNMLCYGYGWMVIITIESMSPIYIYKCQIDHSHRSVTKKQPKMYNCI